MPKRPPRLCPTCRTLITSQRCPTCTPAPWANSKRSGGSRAWRRLRRVVFNEQGGMCAVPGCPDLADQLDHIVPVSEGGTDERSNVQALCLDHHTEKTQQEAARARWPTPPTPTEPA